jgi:erythromycin esterase-like protein
MAQGLLNSRRCRTGDDFIQGGKVDLDKALPALGFWITDTAELRKFLVELRTLNQRLAGNDKIHLWGVDVQNTTPPVDTLVAHAGALGITEAQQALLHRLEQRGKRVRDFTPSERAEVDALLVRLGQARSAAMLTLRDVRAGFDAIAVVRDGHDSTPSATGVCTATH